jgi:NifU-like protein involved in Fe-S cluster formation
MDRCNHPRTIGVIEDADVAVRWPRPWGPAPNKLLCSNLGAETLSLAIKNYQEKSGATPKAGGA